jgi:hypothetical protein
MSIKFSLFIYLFLLLITPIFANYEITYEEDTSIPWKYVLHRTTNSDYIILTEDILLEESSSSTIHTILFPNLGPTEYARLFRYPANNEDYLFRKFGLTLDTTYIETTIQNFEFTKYIAGDENNGGISSCEIDSLNADYVQSNLQPLKAGEREVVNTNYIEDIMKKHYYMKAFTFIEATKTSGTGKRYFFPIDFRGAGPNHYEESSSTEFEEYTYNMNSYNDNTNNDGTTMEQVNGYLILGSSEQFTFEYPKDLITSIDDEKFPYQLLKPNVNTDISFSEDLDEIKKYLEFRCNYGNSNIINDPFSISEYESKIDSLNFVRDRGKDISDPNYCGEFQIKVHALPIDGKCDFDSDGFLETNEAVGESRDIERIKIKDKWADDDNDNKINKEDRCDETAGYDLLRGCDKPYIIMSASCFAQARIDLDNNRMICDYSDANSCNFIKSSNTDFTGTSGYVHPDSEHGKFWNFNELLSSGKMDKKYYKCIKDNHNFLKCGGSEKLKGYCEIEYVLSNLPPEDSDFADLIVDDTELVIDDDRERNLFTLDYESSNVYYYDNNNNPTSMPQINKNQERDLTRKITIYKDGEYNRTEYTSELRIALKSHLIKNFKNTSEAVNFVKESANINRQFDFIKNITYNPSTDKSTIRIKFHNYTGNLDNLEGFTLYQAIPKTHLPVYEAIEILDNGSGSFFIKDKDPIIGWYFNETIEDEIIYTIPGESEGGTIILNQEAYLLNGPNIIINYRENICNPDEAHLFDLEKLDASRVYPAGNGPLNSYKVCVAHSSLDLDNNNNNKFKKVLDIDTSTNNISLKENLDLSVYLSVDTAEDLWWDFQIGEENPGNYSCLGSFDNKYNSLFGDCLYNTTNRIWINLIPDIFPPETKLEEYIPAHSVTFELKAIDNHSGVKNIKYCVTDLGSNCIPSITVNGDYVRDMITCPNPWACLKKVVFFATDNKDNIEDIKEEEIRLLDEGSSCDSDCTSKPSPNRFLKECRNLNGCKYYALPDEIGDDRGKAVAQACDLFSIGAWAKISLEEEVLCPSGPIRKTRFTNNKIELDAPNCDQIKTISYPAILEGEQILIKVISCIN